MTASTFDKKLKPYIISPPEPKYPTDGKPLYFSDSDKLGQPGRIMIPFVVSDIETVPSDRKMYELLYMDNARVAALENMTPEKRHAEFMNAYRALNGEVLETFQTLMLAYETKNAMQNPYLRNKQITQMRNKAQRTGINWRRVKVSDNDIVAIANGRFTMVINMLKPEPFVEDITFCGVEYLGTEQSTNDELMKLFLAEIELWQPIVIGHNYQKYDFEVINHQRSRMGIKAPYFESLGLQGQHRGNSSSTPKYSIKLGGLKYLDRLIDTMLMLSANGSKFIGLDDAAKNYGAPGKTGKANRVFEHFYLGENLINALYCQNDIHNNLVVFIRACMERANVLPPALINKFLRAQRDFLKMQKAKGCPASSEFYKLWMKQKSNFSQI